MDRDAPRRPRRPRSCASRSLDDLEVRFDAGEWLRTEISAKFTADGVRAELWQAGLVVERAVDRRRRRLPAHPGPPLLLSAQVAVSLTSHGEGDGAVRVRRRHRQALRRRRGAPRRRPRRRAGHDRRPPRARRAAARRRCCASSPASSGPTPAPSRSAAATSPPSTCPPERRNVGMVFQDWALFPHMTVERNVGYGIPKRDPDRAAAHRRGPRPGRPHRPRRPPARHALRRPAAAGRAGPGPGAPARACCSSTSRSRTSTPTLRVQVRAEVHALLDDLGITSVFVTHDQDEAFVLGDHVAVMSGGRIVQAAPPAELYARPATPWVATFVGDANLVAGDATGTVAETAARRRAAGRAGVGPGAGARAPGDGAAATTATAPWSSSPSTTATTASTSCAPTAARRCGCGRPPTPIAERGDRVDVALRRPAPTPFALTPAPTPTSSRDRRDRGRAGGPGGGLGGGARRARGHGRRAGRPRRRHGGQPHRGRPAGRPRQPPPPPQHRPRGARRAPRACSATTSRCAPATAASSSPAAGSASRCSRRPRAQPPARVRRPAPPSTPSPHRCGGPRADTFGEVVRAGLGPTVADAVYRPYARKLWDADPDELTGELARRRVSASGPVDIARRLVRGRQPAGRAFLYPRRGFGQIAEAVADAATSPTAGATDHASATTVDRALAIARDASTVLSTMPVTVAGRRPRRPSRSTLRHRAMLIVWVVLDRPQWTTFDAHYLPDPAHPVARLSEPRNYRAVADDPADRTVLCAEVPCWRRRRRCGRRATTSSAPSWPTPAPARACRRSGRSASRCARLPRVYPVYRPGFEWELARAELARRRGRPRAASRPSAARACSSPTTPTTPWPWAGRRRAASVRTARSTPPAWAAARPAFRSNVVED